MCGDITVGEYGESVYSHEAYADIVAQEGNDWVIINFNSDEY